MAKELIYTRMVLYTKVIGLTMSIMARALKSGLTVPRSLENTLKARKMVSESLNGPMEARMKETSSKTRWMDTGPMFGKMPEHTLASGKTTWCTARACSSGQTVESTLVATSKTRSRAQELSDGKRIWLRASSYLFCHFARLTSVN